MKFIAGVLAAFCSIAAHAVDGAVVSTYSYPRVLVFSHDRHTITAQGEILVCAYPARPTPNKGCLDDNNTSKWMRASDINITGHTWGGYQYYVTSRPETTLYLYFTPKR